MAEPQMPPNIVRRGAPPGGGPIESQPNGGRPGRIGVPPHVVTPENQAFIREKAQTHTQEQIAIALGISADTIQRHYATEFAEGRMDAVDKVASGVLKRAMEGSIPDSFFFLKCRGGWSQRVELTGKDGGPIQTVDLSRALEGKTEDELRTIQQFLGVLASQGGISVAGGDPGLAQSSDQGDRAPTDGADQE